MRKPSRAIYHMSIALLYSVLKFAWNLYLKYVKSFTALSDEYTEAYGQQQLEAITAAQALPDNEQRAGTRQQTGNKLNKTAKKGVMVWKQLRGFIIKSYSSAEDQQTALKLAGIAHYDKAASNNYSEASLLLSDGLTFLTDNADDLAKGGMPTRFIDAFTTAKKAFDEQQALYGTAKGTAKNGTIDKIAANNTLFTNMKLMMADAATIFTDQLDIQNQFTLAAIKRLITVDNVSGIHFVVRNSQTKLPLNTATIAIVGFKDAFLVNKRGVLDIHLPKATYYYSVTIPGYNTYQGFVVLDTNVMRRTEVLVTTVASSSAIM